MNLGELKGWRASALARHLDVDLATARKIKTGELPLDQAAPAEDVDIMETEDHTERDGEQ